MNTRNKKIIQTSYFGILGNVVLVAIKATIGLFAKSISIVMDAVNNLTDVLSSTITIIGTKLSGKKPDKKHPYGHGRIEYLTATALGLIILFAGVTAIVEGVKSIIDYFQNGTLPNFSIIQIIIIGLAIFVKIFLGFFFKKRGKELESDVLAASGTDALFDAVLSTATLLGAIVAYSFGFYVEGYLTLIIAIFIIRSGIEVITDAVNDLIGTRVDDEFKLEVRKIILSVPGAISAHDLIIHNYGNGNYIGSVHVTINNNMRAVEIQEMERQIAVKAYNELHIILTVGIYVLNDDSEHKAIRSFILDHIKDNKNILELHGLFVDKVNKKVSFDLVLSFETDNPHLIKETYEKILKQEFNDYDFYCNLDFDY